MLFSNIYVTGKDAAIFLQGQITADIFNLESPSFIKNNPATDISKNSGLAGVCNTKGRLIAIFWITHQSNEIILTLPSELAELVTTLFKKFIFRAKVFFSIQHNINIESITDSEDIPWITLVTKELFVPQMINLDCLNGINFKKGCYIGQEVIARLHYLGRNKRRMIACKLAPLNDESIMTSDQIINIGDSVFIKDDPEPIGQIITINTRIILLSIQIIHKDKLLYCNSMLLVPVKLPYHVAELEA